MKKLLLLLLLLWGVFVCFGQEKPNKLEQLAETSLYPVCKALGIDPTTTAIRCASMLLNEDDDFKSDNDEVVTARLFALYVEWQAYGKIAESLFTIQK